MTETAPARPSLRRELWLVTACTTLLALFSLLYCYSHGYLLLYGDAVAHLHIARRIFDSRTPGFRQLGSVWLPLSHLLLIPFVQKMSWWQSGLAGAWPSMACYVASSIGLYWLAHCFMRASTAVLAVAFFALNPGLLYFATTAMTEPFFLAEMIWAALLLVLFAREAASPREGNAGRLLLITGGVLVCAVFTRYDGWIYAAAAWCVATATVVRRRNLREPLTGAWVLFTALVAIAPLLWIAYNAKQFHDPLDFLRGPYSARAIEARTTPPRAGHYPGFHSMRIAWFYFLKAAELGAAAKRSGNTIFWAAVAGTVLLLLNNFRRAGSRVPAGIAAALLLWIPLPFYAYSIAYGSVPIFIPVWQPYSWYNTRYGMEMLPAFALFSACLVEACIRWKPRFTIVVVSFAGVLIALNTISLFRAGPLVFQEAVANSRTRIPFERALARSLSELPSGASILTYTSEHIGAFEQAGVPLKNTINEGDYFLWRAALDHPAAAASFTVAVDGDAVAAAVSKHPEGLQLLMVICGKGQPCARVYRSEIHKSNRSQVSTDDSRIGRPGGSIAAMHAAGDRGIGSALREREVE